jgi:hypothetical protein
MNKLAIATRIVYIRSKSIQDIGRHSAGSYAAFMYVKVRTGQEAAHVIIPPMVLIWQIPRSFGRADDLPIIRLADASGPAAFCTGWRTSSPVLVVTYMQRQLKTFESLQES